MDSGGPDFQQVPLGPDPQGEQNILGTAGLFGNFLRGGAPGQGPLDETLNRFNLPLDILEGALRGDLSGGAASQLQSRALQDMLQSQSQTRQQLESRLGQVPQQFGSERLRAQLLGQQGQQRSNLNTDLIMNLIQNLSPLLGQATQGQLGRAGVQGQALQGSQQFNRASQGRQAQDINKIIAGNQRQQGGGLGGIGALAGIALPAVAGSFIGGPAGTAAGLGLGQLDLSSLGTSFFGN